MFCLQAQPTARAREPGVVVVVVQKRSMLGIGNRCLNAVAELVMFQKKFKPRQEDSSSYRERNRTSKKAFSGKPAGAQGGRIEDENGEVVPSGRKPPKQSAQSYAVWLLARKEWSAQELRQRLVIRGYSPEQAEQALTVLQGHGLQDDARYAGMHSRSKASVHGNRRIVQSLRDKGLAPDLIESAVSELPEESERAREAVYRFEGKEPDFQLKTKVWRYLMSRGFSGRAVEAAWRQLVETWQSSGAGLSNDSHEACDNEIPD